MRELPKNQLDPRIKTVWRISDGIVLFFCLAPIVLPFVFIGPAVGFEGMMVIDVILLAVSIVIAVFVECVLPTIRFARWRYELTEDYVEISKGIIWRQRYMIPFIRVQNTDTKQGPIMRAFGLSCVTLSTAAGEHVIPGLAVEIADELRDKAAELARLAREDV